MKRTILFFLLYSLIIRCAAQKYLDTICWVKVNEQNCMPYMNKYSRIDSLNTLFNKHKVHFYKKALPFAKNPKLLKIYEIHSAGKIDSLIAELTNKYNSQFSSFSKFEADSVEKMVYDPSDYMWTIDWLWHLKKTQCNLAWDITKGSQDIKIAILDYNFDITHPDLANKIYPLYDPYDNSTFSCSATAGYLVHGTTVASFAGAETDGGGDLASAGFNTMLIAYHTGSRQTVLQKALHASNVMGAKIIISCAGSGSLGCYPDATTGEELIVKEILDNGTAIIWPAGNGSTETHCEYSPNVFHAFYPFNPVYDDRIIIVSGTSKGDSLYYLNENGVEKTWSYFSEVDICAPGHELMGAGTSICNTSGWPYYGSPGFGGTSFATPIAAGIAALVLSVNPCIEPGDLKFILKSTTDPVADEANYPGMVGAGRINAYKAVKLAKGEDGVTIASGENIVWTAPKHFNTNIEIKTGGTLTIESKIFLDEHVKLVINQGGKLIINGGHLTTFCDDLWQGIELWGNKDESQYISGAQGKVVLENGAVIENALNAIRTIKSLGDIDGDGNEDYDWAYTGGIVQANNAIFRNNKNGIWLGSYHNSHPFTEAPMSNVGYIKNCTFETTSEYIDISNPPYEFIGLYDVDGISIYGNTFRNTNTDYTGNGIMSYDANYNVKPLCISPIYPCTEYQPNTFENLYYGIYADNSNNFIPVTINGNNFNNNFRSITLKNINNATITKNNFDIFNKFFA